MLENENSSKHRGVFACVSAATFTKDSVCSGILAEMEINELKGPLDNVKCVQSNHHLEVCYSNTVLLHLCEQL